MTDPIPPFCVDCQHYKPTPAARVKHNCLRESEEYKTDLITGKPIWKIKDCTQERRIFTDVKTSGPHRCGPQGQYFKTKQEKSNDE